MAVHQPDLCVAVSEDDLPDKPHSHWLIGCSVAAVLGVLLLLGACRLGEAGIRRNVVHAPQVDTALDGVRLTARTIDFAPMCDIGPAVCAEAMARGGRLYIVWTDVRWPGEPRTRHYPIISIPLEGPADH
ncbi:MAG TPA: hypothetical protein VKE41_01795 [Roseiflexaceae bacterium]|nr:hypothetical protein [Roseiflexaceae bacterium]